MLSFSLAREVAKKDAKTQLHLVRRLRDALQEGKEKKDEEIDKIKKEVSKSRMKRVRSHGEIQEKLDMYENLDKDSLSEGQKAHVYGMMKVLQWVLNNDVDFSKPRPPFISETTFED